MFYTDDPIADFDAYDAEQNRRLAKLPICDHCGYPIEDDKLWDFRGYLYHDDCAADEFRRDTEDYIV